MSADDGVAGKITGGGGARVPRVAGLTIVVIVVWQQWFQIFHRRHEVTVAVRVHSRNGFGQNSQGSISAC
jgi:hypothetical protein